MRHHRRTTNRRVNPPRHTRKRQSGAVGVCLLAAIGGLLVVGAVTVNTDHIKLQPVLSGSMRPGIEPGDLAIIRSVPAKRLQVGEIIAYLPPGQSTPVMHRIVSITPEGIVTKGDANAAPDPWGRVQPQSSTVARLVAVVPKVGFLTDIRRQLLVGSGAVLLGALALGAWARSRTARRSGAGMDRTPTMSAAQLNVPTRPKRGMFA